MAETKTEHYNELMNNILLSIIFVYSKKYLQILNQRLLWKNVGQIKELNPQTYNSLYY